MKTLTDLLKIDHSFTEGHLAVVTGTAVSGANTVPHDLNAKPDIMFQMPGSAVLSPSADDKNLTFSASAAGAYAFLLVNKHSLWGDGQWDSIVANVSPGGPTAIPHGLIRKPDVVALGGRTGADVKLAEVSADDHNVYVVNSGTSTEPAELLMVAVHSLIDVPDEE